MNQAELLTNLVHFEETHAFYVIPRSCLMTGVALRDLNVFTTPAALSFTLSDNLLVNHFKVHHVVARRGLMTLGAIG